MSTEQVEPTTQEQVSEPAPAPTEPAAPSAPTEEQLLDAAVSAMDDGGTAEPAGDDQPAAEQAESVPPADDPSKSRADYWRQVTDLDRQNRELKGQVKQSEQMRSQVEQMRQLAKDDPIKLAQHLGISLDSLLDSLTGGDPSQAAAQQEPQRAMAPEIQAIVEQNKQLQARLDALEGGITAERKQTIKGRQVSAIDGIATKAGATLVKSEGEHELVLETAAAMAQQSGWTPHQIQAGREQLYASAVEAVESHLRDEKRAEYERLKGIFGAPTTTALPAQPVPAAPTLGAAPGDTPAPRPKTDDELLDEAVAAMSA